MQADRLRRLVARGAYRQALPAVEEYVRAAARTGDPEAMRQACALLEWARRATLAGRADAAARFARLRPAPRAYAPAAEPAHTWTLAG